MKWLPWRKKSPPQDTGAAGPQAPRQNHTTAPAAQSDEASGRAAHTTSVAVSNDEQPHDQQDSSSFAPDSLLSPSYRGDEELVAEILQSKDKDACLHASDALGNTPLHLASFNGHIGVVRLLLAHGADANRQNGELDTPIYMAVLANSIECVVALAEKRVQFNCQNVEGFSPLHYAAGEGFLDITRYLVEKCAADPEVPDNLGLTPGFCAVLQGRADVADYLLRTSAAGVRARNVSSDTMLHCALKATSCDPRMLKILIHYGADLAAVGADGLTCERMLAARGFEELIAYAHSRRRAAESPGPKSIPTKGDRPAAAAAATASGAAAAGGEDAAGGQDAGPVPAPAPAPAPAPPAPAQPKHLPFMRKYMSSYIEVWGDVPAKPTFSDKVLQTEWEFIRPAPAR